MIIRVAWGKSNAPSLTESSAPIVVIDALRMSATIIVAVHLGMKVIPVASAETALAMKSDKILTAGDRGGKKIHGLDLGNSPSQLLYGKRTGFRHLALTTTNGIPALFAIADHSAAVLIGSPLNLRALAEWIMDRSLGCLSFLLAGQQGDKNQEDAITASLLLAHLGVPIPKTLPPPVAPAKLKDLFMKTDAAHRLISLGYGEDVLLCASIDRFSIVPRLRKRDMAWYCRVNSYRAKPFRDLVPPGSNSGELVPDRSSVFP